MIIWKFKGKEEEILYLSESLSIIEEIIPDMEPGNEVLSVTTTWYGKDYQDCIHPRLYGVEYTGGSGKEHRFKYFMAESLSDCEKLFWKYFEDAPSPDRYITRIIYLGDICKFKL